MECLEMGKVGGGTSGVGQVWSKSVAAHALGGRSPTGQVHTSSGQTDAGRHHLSLTLTPHDHPHLEVMSAAQREG